MFDPSGPHIIILLVVVLLLFGSTRLPGAAKALGSSMHIFKKSIKGLDENGQPIDDTTVTQVTTVPKPAPAQQLPNPVPGQDATQQQLQDIQRQLQDLQRQTPGGNGVNGAPVPDPQRSQPL
jgi:sec-independent protein translocase protein TatA